MSAGIVAETLTLLDTYIILIKTFLSSFDTSFNGNLTGKHSPEIPTQALQDLLNFNKQWQIAIENLEKHQRNQYILYDLSRSVTSTSEHIDEIFERIVNFKADIQKLTLDQSLNQIHLIDYTTLLSYASKLAPYTSAPPGFRGENENNNSAPPASIHPPFPTEEVMRRGVLNMETIPLGQTTENAAQQPHIPTMTSHETIQSSTLSTMKVKSTMDDEKPLEFFDLDLNPDLQ